MRPSWRPRSTSCGGSRTTSTRNLRPSTGPAERTEPLRMKPLTIRTSFAWAFSEQTLQQLVQLAAAVIIARLLTPEEMGIFALAYAASAVLTALRSFGVGNYLIREPDLDIVKVRSAFGVMLLISWALGLVLFLGRHAIADLYGRPSFAEVMRRLAQIGRAHVCTPVTNAH